MKPHDLKPAPGAKTARKRAGRGEGSGTGKTSGRGTKGTRARGEVHAFFEGGQMPLARRVPKLKGFKPPHQTVYEPVNLRDLGRVSGSDIGPDDLRAAGLIKGRKPLVKILGSGDIDRKVTVRAHAISGAARSKIEAAGGKVELLDTPSRKKPKGGSK
jgi:large subunit ribosomal protein L15